MDTTRGVENMTKMAEHEQGTFLSLKAENAWFINELLFTDTIILQRLFLFSWQLSTIWFLHHETQNKFFKFYTCYVFSYMVT